MRGASANTTRVFCPTAPNAWIGSASRLAHLDVRECSNFYDAAEVERVFYPEDREALLLEFFPDATDALVYKPRLSSTKDYTGDRTEDQDSNNPGVNANYAKTSRAQRLERQ